MVSEHDYHLVIIGGGIHGVGVAQAAACRGLRVLLIEKSRLAAGTSSRSSKLIHGGLRYLESFQFSVVRECLRERRILARVASDLVHWIPFHIPVYPDSRRGPFLLRAGLTVYAILGGLHARSRFGSVPRARWDSLDGLETTGLRTVFRYWDAQTDDTQLTCAVMRSARSLGAELACPATFVGASFTDNGYRVEFEDESGVQVVTATTLVNAGGPWITEIEARIQPAVELPDIELVQGTHVLLPGRIEHGIYYIESPRDRRPLFVMPWQENTLVGTTETPFVGDPDAVQPLDDEHEYLLEAVSHAFPGRSTSMITSFAGLRVLPRGGSPSPTPRSINRRSRETLLAVERPRAPTRLAIVGGKLTSYRSTAERVLARLAPSLPARPAIARTDRLLLPAPEIPVRPTVEL